ncbi:MAG: YraN family protein [Spirochaetaceae bacterium]|nr:YraN family protein [Spirochaetaceae bacterium]
MRQSTFTKGRFGEELAARELEKLGITVIERNFRALGGEIDLIGVEEATLVFVEVKNWTRYSIGDLEISINKKKRERIIETAKYFMLNNRKYSDMSVRFDIIFIGDGAVTHIASAWQENI